MLVVLTCECGSAEQLVRSAMHRYEYKNWAMEPIYRGKKNCLQSVENLIRKFPDDQKLRELFAFINNNSKWAVFLGYDEESADWADISHGKMKEDVDAEVVVNKYT